MELQKVAEALRKRNFEARVFETKEEASEYLNSQIDGASVGFGGSITSKQMGLYESLGEHNTVYWHWYGADVKDAAFADYYISSVNGMSEDGEMILIDGKGNRVAAVMYGHKKVFFVVGRNKIAEDYDKALWRARNLAAPPNCARLGLSNPCVKGGKCFDCKSPQRICNYFLDIKRPTSDGMPVEVLLINEDLGY